MSIINKYTKKLEDILKDDNDYKKMEVEFTLLLNQLNTSLSKKNSRSRIRLTLAGNISQLISQSNLNYNFDGLTVRYWLLSKMQSHPLFATNYVSRFFSYHDSRFLLTNAQKVIDAEKCKVNVALRVLMWRQGLRKRERKDVISKMNHAIYKSSKLSIN